MTISMDAEKAFGKIQHLFIKNKTLKKLGIKGSFFNLIKNIFEKPTANMMFTG